MEPELNKSFINGFLATIAPGAFILLYTIWGVSIFYPDQPNYFTNNQLLFLFIFLIFSYIIGLIIETLSARLEGLFLKAIYGKHPSLVIIDANKHWLEDLDEFYYTTLKISLYDRNKTDMQPKPGEYNSKKLDKYNLTQFERFASFVLTKEEIDGKTDHLKSKYLLLRNLLFAFVICSLSGIVFFHYGHLHNDSKNIFYEPDFILASSIILILSSIFLFIYFRATRLEYLSNLYRDIRFHYLLNIKK